MRTVKARGLLVMVAYVAAVVAWVRFGVPLLDYAVALTVTHVGVFALVLSGWVWAASAPDDGPLS